jgi:hypothetical protein
MKGEVFKNDDVTLQWELVGAELEKGRRDTLLMLIVEE